MSNEINVDLGILELNMFGLIIDHRVLLDRGLVNLDPAMTGINRFSIYVVYGWLELDRCSQKIVCCLRKRRMITDLYRYVSSEMGQIDNIYGTVKYLHEKMRQFKFKL